MRILIADDDPEFLEFAAHVLRERAVHDLTVVGDGQQALEAALSDVPDAVILGSIMPRMNGLEVCRTVRARSLNSGIYMAIVTKYGGPEVLAECLSAGADDVITKPVPADMFAARIELSRPRVPEENASVLGMQEALRRAEAQGNGELVIRNGDASARVFFYQGQVAWAHLDDGSEAFLQALARELGFDSKAMRQVIDQCRRTGVRFTDAITRQGLASRTRLRQSIQRWMADALSKIVHWAHARSIFLPQRRAYADDVLFSLEELGVPRTLSESTVPRALRNMLPTVGSDSNGLLPGPIDDWRRVFVIKDRAPPSINAMLDRCIADEGVIGVAALASGSGYCLGMRGAGLDADAAWAQLRSLKAVMKLGRVEDGIVATDHYVHLARPLPQHTDVFLYAVVDTSATSLAMARIRLRQVAERRQPESAPESSRLS